VTAEQLVGKTPIEIVALLSESWSNQTLQLMQCNVQMENLKLWKATMIQYLEGESDEVIIYETDGSGIEGTDEDD